VTPLISLNLATIASSNNSRLFCEVTIAVTWAWTPSPTKALSTSVKQTSGTSAVSRTSRDQTSEASAARQSIEMR
jgi:hypothetical protein